MSEENYPINRDDEDFVRNERITLQALSIFSQLVKASKNERQELVKRYNALVSGLKSRE